MTLFDWLRTIAFALNDDEPGRPFQRYTLKDMIAAYNAAMTLGAQYRKDLFTELRVVKLAPGKYQDVRGCCGEVLDVLEQTDAAGNLIAEIKGARDHKTTSKRNWKKPSCLARPEGVDYVVRNADIDSNLNGRFTVDPPVPCDANVYVLAKCVKAPCALTEADQGVTIPEQSVVVTAAWHYVLGQMLTGDQFANAAGGNKNYHHRLFFEILGVTQRQEDRIESREQA